MASTENCYCGKKRNLSLVDLLCHGCSKWFHEACISFPMGKLVPFNTNYMFVCKACSPNGLENFKKNQATMQQMAITAIANIQTSAFSSGNPKTLFSRDKEIIPYIEQNWEAMTTMPRRSTQSWYATIHRMLQKDTQTLFAYEECQENGPMFGLISQDFESIKPNYEMLVKIRDFRQEGYTQALSKNNRNTKRKLGVGSESGPIGKKGRTNSELSNIKLPPSGYPLEHPFNKDGYRYILAEPDPHAPFRQEFDESSDWAGKPIPGWLYRTVVPNNALLTLHDRAPQMKIAEDRLAVTGDKGYCMVRATHAVNRGNWYFEVTIEEMPEGSATRIGWGQEYSNLQAPLGYDKFGYSWRSRKGTKFHDSNGKHYSESYGEGDTLGLLIELPEEPYINYLPQTFKDRPLVKFKSHLYYEDKDKVQETLKTLKVKEKSKISFFKNGQFQGVAFTDIYGGAYFPTISLYKNTTVSVNFGSALKYPGILEKHNCRPMSERVEDLVSEQCLSDMLYFTENDGKLNL
ncbi:ASH2L family protein [Megaselia abdita]